MISRGMSTRGVGAIWGIIALVALIAIVVAFVAFPAFFLAVLVALAGLVTLVVSKGQPYGLTLGVVLILAAVILGLAAQASTLSLAVVHAIP